jgi:hypothetical protein
MFFGMVEMRVIAECGARHASQTISQGKSFGWEPGTVAASKGRGSVAAADGFCWRRQSRNKLASIGVV